MKKIKVYMRKFASLKSMYMLLYAWITLLCITMIYNITDSRRSQIRSESTTAFQQALSREKNIKLTKSISFRDSSLSDSISYEEKEMWCDQDYLSSKDTNRIFLDSLFRVELAHSDIKAQTAVRCKKKEITTISSSDSSFLKNAIALESIIYRINENKEENIELQAYVRISPLFLLARSSSIGLVLFLYVLSLGIIYGIYRYWKEKSKVILTEKKVIEKKVVTFVPSFSKEGTLPFGLQFDKQSGILRYKDIHVTLTGQRLKLFKYLLNFRQSVVKHQIIYSEVFGKRLQDKNLNKSERDAISATIARLREDLAPIPIIQIKSYRGSGYQIVITEPEEDTAVQPMMKSNEKLL